MLVALTSRRQPAPSIRSAVQAGALVDFGTEDLLVGAQSSPLQSGGKRLWCVGNAFSTEHKPLSYEQLFSQIHFPLPVSCAPLPHFHGAFGGLALEASQKRAIVFSDRLGLMPIYFVRTQELVLAGDSLFEVTRFLKTPLTTNEAAWAQWLMFGSFLGSDTPYCEVQRLLPGECWNIELSSLRAEATRSQPRPIFSEETLTREEAVTETLKLFARAVERIVHANAHFSLMQPLSGGWDSRLIAGTLRRLEIPFESVTTSWDSGNDKEQVCAARVAAHLGIRNRYYELEPDYYLKVFERYTQETDYASVLHSWQENFIAQLSLPGPALALDGYGGDLLLRAFLQPRPEAQQAHDAPVKDFYDHYRLKYGIENLLAKPARPLVEALARESLQAELGSAPAAPDHLRFIFENRNRRNIGLGPLRILSRRMRVAFPFLDREFLEFAWRIPASIRFDSTFYPELLDRTFPDLGQIPSSNTNHGSGSFRQVPIHKHAPEVLAFFRKVLEQHPEHLGQLFDPEAISLSFERIQKNPVQFIPAEFNRLEMAAHFCCWLDKERARLEPIQFVQNRVRKDSAFEPGAVGSASRPYQEGKAVPSLSVPKLLVPSEVMQAMREWRAFQSRNGGGKPKLPLILTMDIEGFAPGDIYAAHTSEGDPFERLVLGRFPNQSSTLEKIYRGPGDLCAPWTLFIEMGALWRFGEAGLVELFQILRGSTHEIALHLHPFSLPKTFFEERSLNWNSYQSGTGLRQILKEAASEFARISGGAPISYRSGRFDVFDGHFEALAACGLRTDSSLYQHSPYNHSQFGHDVANRLGFTREGILEMPVTTYFDRRSFADNLRPAMLDFDFTPLPIIFELLSRAHAQEMSAVTMLAHSWSFAESYRTNGKVIHFAPSTAAEEKLRWIIDFCGDSPGLEFGTCASLAAKIDGTNGLKGRFDGLIEVNGKPDCAMAGSAQVPEPTRYSWMSMHPAVTISYPAPTAMRLSWSSFHPKDALYAELFGGSYLEPPPEDLRALVCLAQGQEIHVFFRHEADAKVDLFVFFMQYDQTGRVRNDSKTVRAAATPRFESLRFDRDPAAETFKIAIKLIPSEPSSGSVRLDGLWLQRSSQFLALK